jgi:hypothetical protein
MQNIQYPSERLEAIEREIDQATARLWEAKLAYKRAKAQVKVARKARKQLRKEHIRLQEELSGEKTAAAPEQPQEGASVASLKVADSPEKPKARRKTKKVKLRPPAREEVKERPADETAQ